MFENLVASLFDPIAIAVTPSLNCETQDTYQINGKFMQYLYQAMRMVGYLETNCKTNTLHMLFHLWLNFGTIYAVTYYVIFFSKSSWHFRICVWWTFMFLNQAHFVLGWGLNYSFKNYIYLKFYNIKSIN